MARPVRKTAPCPRPSGNEVPRAGDSWWFIDAVPQLSLPVAVALLATACDSSSAARPPPTDRREALGGGLPCPPTDQGDAEDVGDADGFPEALEDEETDQGDAALEALDSLEAVGDDADAFPNVARGAIEVAGTRTVEAVLSWSDDGALGDFRLGVNDVRPFIETLGRAELPGSLAEAACESWDLTVSPVDAAHPNIVRVGVWCRNGEDCFEATETAMLIEVSGSATTRVLWAGPGTVERNSFDTCLRWELVDFRFVGRELEITRTPECHWEPQVEPPVCDVGSREDCLRHGPSVVTRVPLP